MTIHETGHALGLPDLYDPEETNGIGPKGGVGGLDMMDMNSGDLNGYFKFLLGWNRPTVVRWGDGNHRAAHRRDLPGRDTRVRERRVRLALFRVLLDREAAAARQRCQRARRGNRRVARRRDAERQRLRVRLQQPGYGAQAGEADGGGRPGAHRKGLPLVGPPLLAVDQSDGGRLLQRRGGAGSVHRTQYTAIRRRPIGSAGLRGLDDKRQDEGEGTTGRASRGYPDLADLG